MVCYNNFTIKILNSDWRFHALINRANNFKNKFTFDKQKKIRTKYARGHFELTIMALPAMLLLFVFSYLPMVGLIIAFKDYKYNLGMFGSPWVGFENFKCLFSSDNFGILLRNTVLYNLGSLAIGTAICVITAIFLSMITKKVLIKVFQSGMFLPYFLSWIVVSYISYALFEYNSGIINSILSKLSLSPISFYTEQKYWPFILVFFSVWKSLGFSTMIYYGSILSIDNELFEAAEIDRCNEFQKVWYITLPHLRHTVITLFLLSIGRILCSDYGLFLYIPQDTGALYDVTDVFDTYILRSLRVAGSVGTSSATGFIQSIVGLFLVSASNWLVGKIDEGESKLF